MTRDTAADQPGVRIERIYEASVHELWALWTTKEGFESWWGPVGCRVEVHALEPRAGGALDYDMIAEAPEHVAFMEKAGLAVSQRNHGTFEVVEPMERLVIAYVMDFVPGVEPYIARLSVDFATEEDRVRMSVLIQPFHDAEWTRLAVEAFTSSLEKVSGALAGGR